MDLSEMLGHDIGFRRDCVQTCFTLLIILQGLFHHGSAVETYTYDAYLRASLLGQNYSSESRPETPQDVTISYELRSLNNLDISRQTMTVAGSLLMSWKDVRFQWNPSEYVGLTSLDSAVPWKPKLFIANSQESSKVYGNNDEAVAVTYTGNVYWSLPISVSVMCTMNVAKFPFDTQTCAIRFAMWTYTTAEVRGVYGSDAFVTKNYVENAEWKLVSTQNYSTYRYLGPVVYETFNFEMTFKRRYTYYEINFILPTVFMSVSVPLTFLLPPESGEKIGYVLTLLLNYTVLMTIISGLLPSTSTQVPLLSSYMLGNIVLCLLAVIISVVIVKMFANEGTPSARTRTLFKALASVVFRKNKKQEKVDDHQTGETIVQPFNSDCKVFEYRDEKFAKEHEEFASELTWVDFSHILDRVAFIVLSATTFAFNVTFMSLMYT